MCDRRNRLEIQRIEAGIAHGFGIDEAGFVRNRAFEIGRVGGIHEGRRDAKLGEGVVEQVPGAAVQ
jgi:hypothetical protein